MRDILASNVKIYNNLKILKNAFKIKGAIRNYLMNLCVFWKSIYIKVNNQYQKIWVYMEILMLFR